jgi:membrane associated rhomboid family serine protease
MIPLADSHPAGKFPLWVTLIIIINVYVFFLEITAPDMQAFITQYALIPDRVNFPYIYTLIPYVTSQFLHGGFLHIISNMLFLWIFGDNVEAGFGNILFPIFYLASGVAGGLLQYIFMPDSTIPMLGASGAIAGVLGAYFAWFGHHKVKTLVPIFGFFTVINVPASVMLFYWIATQFISSAFSFTSSYQDVGGVAYMAHTGGFVFGYIVAKVFHGRNRQIEFLQEIAD